MNKLNKIFFWITLMLIIIGAGSCRIDEEVNKPNILFILADDLGWQDTSVPFGPETTTFNKRYHTPSLERLASQDIHLTEALTTIELHPNIT